MENPTWYNNQVHRCCNIASQSCYFIIPCMTTCSIWCMNMVVYHDSPNNVVQVCSFIKSCTVCYNKHEQASQQPCSSCFFILTVSIICSVKVLLILSRWFRQCDIWSVTYNSALYIYMQSTPVPKVSCMRDVS